MSESTHSAPYRVVILLSGYGTNCQAILDHIAEQKVEVEFSCIISNNPNAYGLQRAMAAGIPTEVVDHRDYPNREAYDQSLGDVIARFHPNLIVLAGFMRILTASFVQRFRGKVINVHPSLLPAHRGLNTHRKVLENHDSQHGVSIHVVTESLDDGPIIVQAGFPVSTLDTEESLEDKVHQLEYTLYPLVVEGFATGQISVLNGSVNVQSEALQAYRPCQLSQ